MQGQDREASGGQEACGKQAKHSIAYRKHISSIEEGKNEIINMGEERSAGMEDEGALDVVTESVGERERVRVCVYVYVRVWWVGRM
jgi:hypothetical protein